MKSIAREKEIKRRKRPKAFKKHCSTDVNKTTEVTKLAKSTASKLDVSLEHAQKLADSIQDKFNSFSKVMSTLQGITNKHVKKNTCPFSNSNILSKWKPQKPNLSSSKSRKRKQTKHKKQLHER